MRRFMLVTISVVLCLSLGAVKKTSASAKELIQKASWSFCASVRNGHMPNRILRKSAAPWQSGIGYKKVLTIMLEFPDVTHRVNKELYDDVWRSEKRPGILKYYQTISSNRLTVDLGSNGVGDWMMLPKSYDQYWTDNDYQGENVLDEVIKDGYGLVTKKGLDLNEYDSDGNGLPDFTVFFFAGNSPAVWGDMLGDFSWSTDKQTFVMVAEDYRAGEYNSPTLIHELAHALLPIYDLYDYSYTSEPVVGWDIMGSGSWVGNCGMCAFSRWKAGWIDVKMIDQPGQYTLDDLNGDGPNKAYGIQIPGADREWLLLENRQKTGVDSFFNGIPSAGIAVYLVDDKRPYEHRFNTLTSKLKTHGFMFLSVLTTDGKLTPETTPSTLPYAKIDRLTPNIGIRGVTKPGSTMTFTFTLDRPKFPVVAVNSKIFMGKVPKNTSKTVDIPFANAGIGTLNINLQPRQNWLTLDRKSFIGNEETITATVDSTGMKLGEQKGSILFTNASSESGGIIEVLFEVTPIVGDLDSNDKVDQKDLVIFTKLYGLKGDDPGFKPEADFNSDGVIDFTDMLMLAKNFKNQR